MENNRKIVHRDLETVTEGFANGVSIGFPLNEQQKEEMIEKACIYSYSPRKKIISII